MSGFYLTYRCPETCRFANVRFLLSTIGRYLVFCILSVWWLSSVAVAQDTRNSSRLNVLILMADQHGPEAIGHFGDPNAITPNLDKLAKSGFSLRQAYCQIPVCTPSRTSVLTGRYAHSHGVIQNSYLADTTMVSFPQVMRKNGYVTACFGKLHTPGREHLDWDVYASGDVKLRGKDVEGQIRLSGTVGLRVHPTIGAPDLSPQATTLEWQAKENTIRFMRENRDRPWLIKCSMDKPHPAFQPPLAYWNKIDRAKLKIPEYPEDDLEDANPRYRQLMEARGMWNMSEEHILDGMQGHYGNVAFVDAMFGEILEELDKLGLRENTLVVYLSDHGEMLGQHGLWTKFVFFDASVRVPFIFSLPGVVQHGARSEALVELIDLFPTIMELTGLNAPESIQGMSLVPLLTGDTDKHRQFVFSEFPLAGRNAPRSEFQSTSMIFDGRYKLVDNGPDGPPELYDQVKDPNEFRNIALLPENKERVERMINRLRQWGNEDRVLTGHRIRRVRE